MSESKSRQMSYRIYFHVIVTWFDCESAVVAGSMCLECPRGRVDKWATTIIYLGDFKKSNGSWNQICKFVEQNKKTGINLLYAPRSWLFIPFHDNMKYLNIYIYNIVMQLDLKHSFFGKWPSIEFMRNSWDTSLLLITVLLYW